MDYPELAAADPYGRGRLITFAPADAALVPKNVMSRFRAREWLRNDADRLRQKVRKITGADFDRETLAPLLAGKFSDAQWNELLEDFMTF